jgi:hypothetical protein
MSVVHLAAGCETVSTLSEGRNEYMYVRGPGSYCLEKDAHHTNVFNMYSLSAKSFAGQALLSVWGPTRVADVPEGSYIIDFRDHTLSAETKNMKGVAPAGETKNVQVTNGKIIVPGSTTANVGILLGYDVVQGFTVPGVLLLAGLRNPLHEDIPYTELEDHRKPRYSVTNYMVNEMDIRAGYRGIVLGGGNNVIRNSRIEVDGNTAIYVYGPGTIIENNTIIVHGKGDRKQWDAAIKLRDADNAIVRNNQFVYDGGLLSKGEAAINLLDSDNVTIDGNTVTGFRKTVRVNGVTTFTESNTKSSDKPLHVLP